MKQNKQRDMDVIIFLKYYKLLYKSKSINFHKCNFKTKINYSKSLIITYNNLEIVIAQC